MIKHLIILILFTLVSYSTLAADKLLATALNTSIINENEKKAIWQTAHILFQRYAQAYELTPTEDDLKQYQQFSIVNKQWNHKDFSHKLAQLQQLEASRELTKDELSNKKQYTRIINSLNDDKSFNLRNPPAYIINAIQRWKVNQALYKKYRGGVVFQQAGLEPIDAWHTFFKQQVNNGDLVFHDPKFEQAFWQTLTPNKAHWSYITAPNDAFKQPFWVSGLTVIAEKINQLESK